MKSLIRSILYSSSLFFSLSNYGQETQFIGLDTYNGGSIFSVYSDGSSYEKLVDFSTGRIPNGSLLKIDDRLWGVTRGGGVNESGTLYSANIHGSDYSKIIDFGLVAGALPIGDLFEYEGKVWGVTLGGGDHGKGVLYSYDIESKTYAKEYDFKEIDGFHSFGLIEHESLLWGMSSSGGANGYGCIFSFDPLTGEYENRYSFNESMGADLYRGLTSVDNKLYGLTGLGGKFDYGSIFSFDIVENHFSVIHDFDLGNGGYPRGQLVATDTSLWGITYGGGINETGVIFSLDTRTNEYVKKYDFGNDQHEPRRPRGSLTLVNDELWGLTQYGGTPGWSDSGSLFSYNTVSNKLRIPEFRSSSNNVDISLLFYNGKLWGVNEESCCTYMDGFIYSIDLDSMHYAIEYDLASSSKGVDPAHGLVEHDGKLYGVTKGGGQFGYGVIFSVNLDGSQYLKIHDFDTTDRGIPSGKLFVSAGYLWGLAEGINNDDGVIYRLHKDGSSYEVIHAFNGQDGSKPSGTLIEFEDRLWGSTRSGGESMHYGTIFSLGMDQNDFTKVHDFDNVNGRVPNGTLNLIGCKLWGTTFNGFSGNSPSSQGIIFSYDPSNARFEKTHTFANVGGGKGLILADGTIWGFGTPTFGYRYGALFSADLNRGSERMQYEFRGISPTATPIVINEKLYGLGRTTENGGLIYSYNISQDELEIIHEQDNFFEVTGDLLALPINDPPKPYFTSTNQVCIQENYPHGETFYSALAVGNGTIEYSIAGQDVNFFDMNIATGELTFVSSPDYETKSAFSLQIAATDTEINVAIYNLLIAIQDIDENPPVIPSDTVVKVSENISMDSVIYIASATDESVITYSLNGTDSEVFSINNISGELRFTVSPDFESQESYEITVIATDEVGNSAEQTLTIEIVDIDEEAPIFSSLSEISISEGILIDSVIYTASASDENDITFMLDGIDAESFSIDESSGELRFLNSPDFESQASYEITIIATDEAGNSAELYLKVQIVEVPLGILNQQEFMYPNPSTDKVNIRFPESIDNILRIRVISISGKTLLSFVPKKSMLYDISSLKQGVYLVFLDNQYRSIYLGKIVKE